LNKGYQSELKVLQQRGDIPQRLQVEHWRQDPDEDNMPDLHQPACQLAHHADGVALVPLADDGRIEDAGSHRVVVLGDVVEVDRVACNFYDV